MRLTSILAAFFISGSAVAGVAAPAHAQTYEGFYSLSGGEHGEVPIGSLTEFQRRL